MSEQLIECGFPEMRERLKRTRLGALQLLARVGGNDGGLLQLVANAHTALQALDELEAAMGERRPPGSNLEDTG